MSDIQSISQNNYILRNIDAADLYVQSPLYTGISSTSAYIGCRPDETVLWSGALTSAVTASEPFTNFEYVDIYIGHGTYGPGQLYKIDFNKMGTTGYFAITRPRGGNNLNIAVMRITADNQTNEIKIVNSKCLSIGGWTNTATGITATTNESEDLNSIYKIVGINRKV